MPNTGIALVNKVTNLIESFFLSKHKSESIPRPQRNIRCPSLGKSAVPQLPACCIKTAIASCVSAPCAGPRWRLEVITCLVTDRCKVLQACTQGCSVASCSGFMFTASYYFAWHPPCSSKPLRCWCQRMHALARLT